MFSICVRDHFMIAHSLRGEVFGPAQRVHGATYVVDAEFARDSLDEHGIVVDIGRARDALRQVLAAFDYRNLDEIDDFRGRNTTTEVLAEAVFTRLSSMLRAGELGDAARAVCALKVTLRESHLAWAAFEDDPRLEPGG
jgi:6-pyruvoyl-tetrahydropterin synthase